MDSEDEWAEENGEDLDKKDEDDEPEEDQEAVSSDEEAEQGFIVSDGHLSVSEYNFSQEGSESQMKKEIENRRTRLEIQKKTSQKLNE